MPWCAQLNLTIIEIYKSSLKYVRTHRIMDDSKLEMSDGKRLSQVNAQRTFFVTHFEF